MKLVDEFPSDINHELLNIIGNESRREILQLLATETNYGNRIASILNLSTPSVHRHIKILNGQDNGDLKLLHQKSITKESFSGHKGAEAKVLEISSQIGLFFAVFPNFLHAQVTELDDTGNLLNDTISLDNFNSELFGVRITPGKNTTETDCFENHIDEIQKLNKEITDLQSDIMEKLYMKNTIMDKIHHSIESDEDLSFEERIILKSIIAYGYDSIELISKLLNMSKGELTNHIIILKKKNWIVDKKVESIITQ